MLPTDDAPPDPTIGNLIRTADAGDGEAADRLFIVLYDELHRLANRQLRRSSRELTLSTTTLLHEVYLNIAGRAGVSFPDRTRFLAYASRAMRGLVIDYARRRQAQKRGGEFHITSSGVEETPGAQDERPASLERLSEGLDTLATVDPALAQLVDLHFFSGFTLTEIAAMRGVSERTVQRDWRKARLLLHRTLQQGTGTDLLP